MLHIYIYIYIYIYDISHLRVKEIHIYNIILVLSAKKGWQLSFRMSWKTLGQKFWKDLNLVKNMLIGDLPMNFIYKEF